MHGTCSGTSHNAWSDWDTVNFGSTNLCHVRRGIRPHQPLGGVLGSISDLVCGASLCNEMITCSSFQKCCSWSTLNQRETAALWIKSAVLIIQHCYWLISWRERDKWERMNEISVDSNEPIRHQLQIAAAAPRLNASTSRVWEVIVECVCVCVCVCVCRSCSLLDLNPLARLPTGPQGIKYNTHTDRFSLWSLFLFSCVCVCVCVCVWSLTISKQKTKGQNKSTVMQQVDGHTTCFIFCLFSHFKCSF